MAEYALPCLVCGRALKNVQEDVDNQPDAGIYLTSQGNYGSTVWDPMDGLFLEFALCDECLRTAGEQGRVYTARTERPVQVEGFGLIGYVAATYRPVPWRAGLPGYDDAYIYDLGPSGLAEFDADLTSGDLRLTRWLTPAMVRTLLTDTSTSV